MKKTINIDRIERDMTKINQINQDPQTGGCTRLSYSPEDRQARDYLQAEFDRLGLEVQVDPVGNIIATYRPEGSQGAPVWIGSHIDTVPNGGQFDGLTGSMVGLECVRSLVEAQAELKRPLALVIFAEEEGSNFGTTTLGSKVMTGRLGLEGLKQLTNSQGQTAYETIRDFGLEVDRAGQDVLKPGDVYAMIELHVEQGGVLEQADKTIGINHTIAGMSSYRVHLMGLSNHAGTAPMVGRRDPLVAAGQIIVDLEAYARLEASETAVATIGKLECYPSASNVINSDVIFHVDIRDIDQASIDQISDQLAHIVQEACQARGIDYQIERVGSSSPAALSAKLVDRFQAQAEANDLSYQLMHSGAVHDCMMLADLTDVMLVFVPSRDGISHSPEEYTSFDDIAVGAQLVYDVLLSLVQE